MIDNYINSYAANLDGLRDFISLLSPVLEENEKLVLDNQEHALKPLKLALKRESLDPKDPERERLQEELYKIFDGEIIFEKKSGDDGEVIRIKGEAKSIDDAFHSINKALQQKTLLYNNALISLLSSVEWFYSQILHYYYNKYPEAAGISKKSLTFAELKSFNNVIDAQNYLIESRVEEILRSSINDWIKELRDNLKLSASYLENALDDLIEIYQRRNLLVHNGGIVNSIYLSKINTELHNNVNIGDMISVSPEYLENAICLYELYFILIAAELWKKIEPGNEKRSEVLIDISFDHLSNERYIISEGISYFILNDNRMPERDRLVAQVNYWLSLKYKGEFETIRNDIETSDFTAKEPVFQLAKECILENEENIFRLLPEVLKSKKITYQAIETWPLFKILRETKRYEIFKAENKEKFEKIE